MNVLSRVGLAPGKILLPKEGLKKWAVVACDQYTSERKYWERVDKYVGDAPSALRLMLPEVYLEDKNLKKRRDDINEAMQSYIDEDVFSEPIEGIFYIERQVDAGKRKGLIATVDLECYDYKNGAASMIRATEDIIIDRLPPRVKIRMKAPLELPHIMILIDDQENKVFDDIEKNIDKTDALYDFELMENGGNIKGYRIDESDYTTLCDNLLNLKNKNDGFLYAMGDGNHSLATAKECWEKISKNLSEEEKKTHPARFCLVEIVNLHDKALVFESIHRVLMNIRENALDEIAQMIGLGEDPLPYYKSGGQGMLLIDYKDGLCVAAVQKGLEKYMAKYKDVKIDYIHGDDTARQLAMHDNYISFIMPVFEKTALFKTVINDGSLPVKSFSMGHAYEKRYYLESRLIKQD